MLLSLQFDKKCLLSQYYELKRPFKSAYEAATAQDGLKQILLRAIENGKNNKFSERRRRDKHLSSAIIYYKCCLPFIECKVANVPALIV